MTRNECLHAGGAVFDGDVVRSHGDAGAEVLHAEGGALLVALGHHDRLRIAGPDAAGFLNRLLTVDVLHLAPGQGARPFLLDAKGKILLAFHLLRVDEQTYLVECSAGHGEDVAARLDMFHFGEALTIEPVDDAFTVITLQGGGAAGVLEALDVRPPEAAWAHAEATIAGHPVRVARVDRAGLPGFDLWLAPDAFAAVWQAARDAGATPSGVDALEVLRVDHGVPGHPNEFGPHAVPLELSVEDGYTEGKGCYPGQEVIERTLALGRPARQLLRLTLDGPADVGADLLSEGRVAGVLTSVATRPDGVVVGLALVKRKYLDAEAFTCGDVAAHPRTTSPAA
ncbi:MAG: folate-binding protein YgfZ [Myxococcales bacterium]|nr:folate-binding protein YgfZ [Myxococcales bacterium]